MKSNTKTHWIAVSIMAMSSLPIGCEEVEEMSTSAWEQEVARVRAATEQYENYDIAVAEGYMDVSGYVPHMGHHYLLPSRVDDTFELEKPEILLYAPDANGHMQLMGVEYSILVEDVSNPGAPPEGFTGSEDEWHFREDMAQWQLHVWTVKENENGIFVPLNPAVTGD